jgi:hypothetical protein
MEGVSDREARSPLTRGRGNRSWSSKARGQPRIGGTTGDVRGHSRSTTGEENAPMGRPPARAARRNEARKGFEADHRVARNRSWICAVKRRPTGVGLPQGGPAPRRRTAHRVGARARESAVGLSHRWKGSTCEVDAARVACSVVERFVGARVVSRLQKSVRSIFP